MASSPVTKPCPICDKPSTPAYRPFCSRRCADVDLHRWLSGSYALPAVETEEDEVSLMPPDPRPRDE